MVQEDRLLAFPTLGQLQEAVEAQAFWSVGHEEMALSRVVISSIAKDPGQDYFARLRPDAVIVRSDKPDQQLAALNVGVRCLLVTGDTPILPYVLARAEEEGTAILATPLGTVEVAERLDALIASAPLAGREKAERAAHLVASAIDAERVLASLRWP
jgi:BioD-like phosphotransacetylase family protein